MGSGRGVPTFLIAFGAASLLAVAAGAYVAERSGVTPRVLGLNLAAWIAGFAAALALVRRAGGRSAAAFALVSLIVLALTLVSPGLQGVHRWVQAGPLRLNAAELFAPGLVVALAAAGWGRPWPWLAGSAAMAVLVVQPDASQATAMAFALAVSLWLSPTPRWGRLAGSLACGAAAATAWLRPDPLAPVPEVEEIFRLAGQVSPVALALAAGALAVACASPLLIAHVAKPRPAALALSAYLAVSAAAPLLGAFPTPLVGMGVSPILGFWLAVGLVAALARRRDAPAP